MRKRQPQLVNPETAHTQEALRILGVPTGKDRTLADIRQRRVDPNADKPKVVEGDIDDGTFVLNLANTLQQQGRIVNKAVRGGKFGDEIHNATLVNANSPDFRVKTQGAADAPGSTTNVSPLGTISALTDEITLPPGKWAVAVFGSIHLSHSTGASVDISTEINGVEGTIRTVSTVGTTGIRCFAHSEIINEADWLQGEQSVNIRVRFRSATSGTTSAKNPQLFTIVRRMG